MELVRPSQLLQYRQSEHNWTKSDSDAQEKTKMGVESIFKTVPLFEVNKKRLSEVLRP